ncbi:hypothetical protein [Brevibacterium sp.]|nr:hypothetical protein [Brevibacterium sp.]
MADELQSRLPCPHSGHEVVEAVGDTVELILRGWTDGRDAHLRM